MRGQIPSLLRSATIIGLNVRDNVFKHASEVLLILVVIKFILQISIIIVIYIIIAISINMIISHLL